ncbi:MAG: HD domain-containing protein [Chthonomonadaceae bacterium]|nr:HD domain-containing protein [Chthonomonadaceae bacterium]
MRGLQIGDLQLGGWDRSGHIKGKQLANLWEERYSRIVVVDSDAEHVARVRTILESSGCGEVIDLPPGRSPSRLAKRVEDLCPDLVMIDPGEGRFQMLEGVQNRLASNELIPLLVFSATESPEMRRHALRLGAADFMAKPGDHDEILLRCRNFLNMRAMHVELRERARSLEDQVFRRTCALEESKAEILARLAMASEWRDDDTGEHTKRVGELSALIAKELGWNDEDVRTIALAAPLHDLGKIGIPDSILLSANGLSKDEFETMKTHTKIGAEILAGSRSPLLEMAETIAMSHHERWDGRGYPNGLSGPDIPQCGRIVAVADVFDALTHDRPYKRAWPVEEAIAEIRKNSGAHFDPAVVEAFLQVVGQPSRRAA